MEYANREKELYNLECDPYELKSYFPEAGDALKERLRGLISLTSCEGERLSAEGQWRLLSTALLGDNKLRHEPLITRSGYTYVVLRLAAEQNYQL